MANRISQRAQAEPSAAVPLRGAVRLFDDAQRRRIALGEQVRAVLQGRDASWMAPAVDEPDAVFAAIEKGSTDGPVPLLARLYRRALDEERESVALVAAAVRGHPTWPWLAEVRGIGPVLAGRLLGRLDIHRAPMPSCFWAYCGLGTITDGEGRRAQRWLSSSGRPSYDRTAKQACYLIGVSFTRQGGRYKTYYRDARDAIDATRPDWPKVRRYLAALRRTEKRFLADLWCVWREAVGLPVAGPHPDAATTPGPWDMTG